jgi:hypothetical protein
MASFNRSRRTLKGLAFLALGYLAIALMAYNLYLFLGMIRR